MKQQEMVRVDQSAPAAPFRVLVATAQSARPSWPGNVDATDIHWSYATHADLRDTLADHQWNLVITDRAKSTVTALMESVPETPIIFLPEADNPETALAEIVQRLGQKAAPPINEEQNLLQAEQNRSRGLFVSTLSHDLKTPLIAQKRLLELLLDGVNKPIEETTRPVVQRTLTALLKNSDSLLDFVDRFLEVYQLESGHVTFTRQHVRLRNLVADCLATLEGDTAGGRILLVNNVPDDLPEIIGDRHLLCRLLNNLMTNAIRHMPKGGSLSVDARYDKNQIDIHVRDTGGGIPTEVMPYIFDPYFSGGSQNLTHNNGLGLYSCRMITDLHGGQIFVSDTDETGTCFRILLPLEAPRHNTP